MSTAEKASIVGGIVGSLAAVVVIFVVVVILWKRRRSSEFKEPNMSSAGADSSFYRGDTEPDNIQIRQRDMPSRSPEALAILSSQQANVENRTRPWDTNSQLAYDSWTDPERQTGKLRVTNPDNRVPGERPPPMNRNGVPLPTIAPLTVANAAHR